MRPFTGVCAGGPWDGQVLCSEEPARKVVLPTEVCALDDIDWEQEDAPSFQEGTYLYKAGARHGEGCFEWQGGDE